MDCRFLDFQIPVFPDSRLSDGMAGSGLGGFWTVSRAGGGCSYTNRVKKLYVFPVWGRYVHGFLAQVLLFTLEPIRIFPSSLSFHYLFTRGPRFWQANATGEDRPQKMNVHDFQLSPSVD